MRSTDNNFEYFVHFIFPVIILVFGLLGNLFGLKVSTRNKLIKIGPLKIYQYLFLIDSIYFIALINNYLAYSYSIGFSLISSFSCKIFRYLSYVFSPVSSMLLIYILIERYLSVKYPVESNMLQIKKIQYIYIISIIILNFIYFLPTFFYYDIRFIDLALSNSTTKTIICKIDDDNEVPFYLFFTSRIIIPFFFIFIFTILLIFKVIQIRNNILTFYSKSEIEKFRKDVYSAVISILANFIIVAFNLPISIIFFINGNYNNTVYMLSLNIFYLSYSFNFYFFILTNSLFRKEFIQMLTIKQKLDLIENTEFFEMK
jgi:hypothetical protein